jgi:hypothetical protein
MDTFGAALLGAVVSGTVIAAVLGLLTTRLVAQAKSDVEDSFRRVVERREIQRALLREVLGPVAAHLARTKAAFRRWDKMNLALEANIIAQSNERIRDILLAQYHLLTPELRRPAIELIVHFDMWLELFGRDRGKKDPDDRGVDFVFAGPEGYPFPREAEKAFETALETVQDELAAFGSRPRRGASKG